MRCIIFCILCLFLVFLTSYEVFSQTNYQTELDTINSKLIEAQNFLLDNKITELRNIMWDEVDPQLKIITDNIENNIETLNYVSIYNLEEINLSHGDIKRGIAMFEKTKIDVTYAINEMDFQKKISEEKDIIEDLRKISLLLPEIEVTYSEKNLKYNVSEYDLDKFSLNIKDVEIYEQIKKMNISYVNSVLEFRRDEILYIYTNSDESNKTLTIKSINKKIKSLSTIKDIKIYEIFPDYVLVPTLNFRTTHVPDNNKNRVLLFEGIFYENTVIPVYFIFKTNKTSEDLSQTLLLYPLEYNLKLNNDENETYVEKKKPDAVKFDDVEIVEKENFIPYILLGILIVIFLVLVLGALVTKDKLAKDLEKYRKRINNLKGNV